MVSGNNLYKALGIRSESDKKIGVVLDKLDIDREELQYYNDKNILPEKNVRERIENHFGISEIELKLEMGIIDHNLLETLRENSEVINQNQVNGNTEKKKLKEKPSKKFETNYGRLYKGDCFNLFPHLEDSSIDLIFADPPFNLNKSYTSGINDDLNDSQYIAWCKRWIDECIRLLKPGGSFFLWNLPKWNTTLASYLNNFLNFRHWIATDIKYSLPIPGRLYPSHYSLLYYIKGKTPKTFNPDRLPMEICDNCYEELKDYGGYKSKMNPNGISLTDVWYDISPVRHSKYKNREGANELSIKLLDRVIQMASKQGDLVFDPFGGAGTTYIVSEMKKRKWIGIELGPLKPILNRFKEIEKERKILDNYREDYNYLFPPETSKKRKKLNLWTSETV